MSTPLSSYRPSDGVLRALGIDPDDVANATPVDGGLSGARITRLWLASRAGDWPGAPRYRSTRIVKEQIAEAGWIASATHDHRIREVALWRTGLATRLPRRIGLAVERIAPREPPPASRTPASAAMLMHDMRSRLMRDPYQAPRGSLPPLILNTLDALAEMHARFWNAPELDDPRLGLASLRDSLLWLSPPAVEHAIHAGHQEPYLWLARRGWKAFFHRIAPEDAATLSATLDAPELALAAIARLPRTLIHGDVWGPNLGRLAPTSRSPRIGSRTLLIDWALVAAAPGIWDPLAMCGAWHTARPTTLLAVYRARLTRRLAARGVRLAAEVWKPLVASAYLRATLTTGEAFARAAEDAPSVIARRQAVARLRWWAHRGAEGARLLESLSER